MRLVQFRDGVLEIRWTWLPFWLAVNPKMKQRVEREMKDAVLIGGVTPEEHDLDALHDFVMRRLMELFPNYEGLGEYLDSIKYIKEAS